MTRLELAKFRKLLESKRDQVTAQLQSSRERIRVERHGDHAEQLQTARECELAVMDLESSYHLLHDVTTALRRIREGDFGVCTHCESVIAPKRLAAVPWTPFCIRCQEASDSGDLAVLESSNAFRAHAA